MRALVVYESMYGNTERVARAIGSALGEAGKVEVMSIDEAASVPADVDLLVVGGPTHAHGVEASMKAYLDRMPAEGLAGRAAAAFDTRLKWPKLVTGAASKGIAERLERKGARVIAEPESFLVTDSDGPLLDGEEARASAWARYLTSEMART
jgi:flavodoxin